jgi:hypothetical protein
VVHDCRPPREEIAGPEYIPGEWCGVTYKAYVDLVVAGNLSYLTVDTDCGCGVIFPGKRRPWWWRLLVAKPRSEERRRATLRGYPRSFSTAPAVVILDADDVVLAEVASGLHLDDLEWFTAGILQAVIGAERHVDRFVFL